MPDTVIYRVKILGKYQPGILVFTDRMGRIIGDGDAETKGLDGDENEAPLIKIDKKKDNLDNKGDQEEVHPEQEEQTIQQPVKVKL